MEIYAIVICITIKIRCYKSDFSDSNDSNFALLFSGAIIKQIELNSYAKLNLKKLKITRVDSPSLKGPQAILT